MREFGLYIDGRFVPARSGRSGGSLDPAKDEAWAQVAHASVEDLDDAIAAAKRAHVSGVWREKPREERAAILMQVASLIFEKTEELALAEVQDSGWTIRMATTAAVANAGQHFVYYSDL